VSGKNLYEDKMKLSQFDISKAVVQKIEAGIARARLLIKNSFAHLTSARWASEKILVDLTSARWASEKIEAALHVHDELPEK